MNLPLNTELRFTRTHWQELGWETNCSLSHICLLNVSSDSRNIQNNWGFFAFDGLTHKGKDFIPDVISQKPAAVFADIRYKDELRSFENDTPFFYASDFFNLSARTIAFLYGQPSDQISITGITGTNGKTTVALFLKKLLEALRYKTMYIGTLGVHIGQKILSQGQSQGMTTPDLISTNRFLKEGIRQKVSHAFLEVSSHALHQKRIEGIDFEVGVFTNLSQDHLDYHKTMEDYFMSKKNLFERMLRQKQKKVRGFVICTDDPYGQRLYKWLESALAQSSAQSSEEKVKKIELLGFKRSETLFRIPRMPLSPKILI